MTYRTQPGTIPHRVAVFLHGKPRSYEVSTADLCAILDCDTENFSHIMSNARYHQIVQARMKSGFGHALFWSAGPVAPQINEDERQIKRRSISSGGLHLEEYEDGTITVKKRERTLELDKDETMILLLFCSKAGKA